MRQALGRAGGAPSDGPFVQAVDFYWLVVMGGGPTATNTRSVFWCQVRESERREMCVIGHISDFGYIKMGRHIQCEGQTMCLL